MKDGGLGVVLWCFDRLRIGHDTHDAFSRFLFVAENVDGVAVALAHLLAVDAGNGLGRGVNARFGQFEDLAVGLVELYREIPRDLDVLLLVFADGNEVGIVDQNVGGHAGQDR